MGLGLDRMLMLRKGMEDIRLLRSTDPRVESVEVLSETPYDELPPAAIASSGSTPGHKNALVRVVLRALEHALTHEEPNDLRDEIYAAIHRGTVWQWASVSRREP